MLSIDVRFGTTCLRNPREPNASIIQTVMLWIERNAATLGHPVASASKMIVESKRPSPDPPSSTRTVTPLIPVPRPLSASRAEGSFLRPILRQTAPTWCARTRAPSRASRSARLSAQGNGCGPALPAAIATPEETIFVAAAVVGIEVDVHARDQRTPELEHATKPSARRLSAVPFNAFAVRPMGCAFDHD